MDFINSMLNKQINGFAFVMHDTGTYTSLAKLISVIFRLSWNQNYGYIVFHVYSQKKPVIGE